MTRFSTQFSASEVYDVARRTLQQLNCGRPVAMKFAWLVYKLTKGVCKFKYRKLDGTIREAVGTLNPEFLGLGAETYHGSPTDTQKYFDLEAGAWRSFKKINVL